MLNYGQERERESPERERDVIIVLGLDPRAGLRNFSEVEYCALPQFRFGLRLQLMFRFSFRFRVRFKF